MSPIILTLFDHTGDKSRKVSIDPDLIAYALPHPAYSEVFLKRENSKLGTFFETPEEIAELITASTSGPAKFINLHAIHTHYAKDTTATAYQISVNPEKITHFDPDPLYEFFKTITIPETIEKDAVSGVPTDIHFGDSSIKVLESYEYILKLLSGA